MFVNTHTLKHHVRVRYRFRPARTHWLAVDKGSSDHERHLGAASDFFSLVGWRARQVSASSSSAKGGHAVGILASKTCKASNQHVQ